MDKEYKCHKCSKLIPINNKLMHDLVCKEKPPQQQQPNRNQQEIFKKQQNDVKDSLKEKENKMDDQIIICEKCNTYIPIQEFEDHLYSHQIQEIEEPEEVLNRHPMDLEQEENGQQREQPLLNPNSNNSNNDNVQQQQQQPQQHHYHIPIEHSIEQRPLPIQNQNEYLNEYLHHTNNRPNDNNNSNVNLPNQQVYYNQNIIPEQQQQPQNNEVTNRTMYQNSQGFTTETIVKTYPNGIVQTTSITKNPNGQIVNTQQSQVLGSNRGNRNIQISSNGPYQINMNMRPQINMIPGQMNMNMVPQQMNMNMVPQQMNMNMMPQRMNMNMHVPNLNASNFNMNMNNLQSSFMMDPFFNQMIQFNNNNSNFERGIAQLIQQVMNHDNPVSEEVINDLPIINIDDPSKLDSDKKQCVICLNEYQKGDKGIILPCIHLFHCECIKSWFQTQDTCPICKFKLNSE